MQMKLFPKLFVIALLLAAVSTVFAQVTPAARQGGSIPLVVGGGYSNFTMDWGPGSRSSGVSAWVDLYPFHGAIKDLGFEAEGRSSKWGNSIPNLRQDTGQLGAIYSLSRGRKVHPYGKFVAGVGSMDFPAFPAFPNYKHDTFLVTSAAGGADIHAYGHIWLRAEYQYQWWHNTFSSTTTPNGITVGAQWDFRKSNAE